MLQYDNSAFYFFALAVISFYLVPSWYSILTRVYQAFFCVNDAKIGAVARTSAEQRKAEELKRQQRGLHKLQSKSFLINLGITVFFSLIYIWLLNSVMTDGEVASFDPFHILEIDHGSDSKIIKKAYRKLSLTYHPDKNPGDRAAEAKFMMVSKAYEALTDAVAKENWEKYGNPDGKQSLQLSIGLPAFLLDSNMRNLVLVAYLIIMVGIIPMAVYTYYNNSSQYGEKDVMYDTYSWYHHTLGEHTTKLAQLPEVLAGSAEFRQRNRPGPNEKESIHKLMTSLKTHMPKPKFNHPVCVKGNLLMHAHLLRKTDLLSDEQKEDLKYMLRCSSALMDAMISVCKHQDAIRAAVTCIEFGQYVTQALWIKDSPLLQLPHFDDTEIGHAKQKVSTVQQYREQTPDQRKDLADLSDAQHNDIINFLKIYPDVSVVHKVFVDDDEDDKVYEGDLCTIQVTLTRNNLQGVDDTAGMVHAPLFPYPKREAWWIILGQLKEGRIIHIEKVKSPGKVVTHDIKFLAPPPGKYEFDVLVKSSGYVGCDYKSRVELETLDNSALPEYKVHPDDAELDDEPTLFEEMLNAHIEQDSDDDDSEEEEEEVADAKNAGADAAAKKREQLRKARQRKDEDDSDDDDEAEEVYADK